MTSTEAHNTIMSKANHSINVGGLFVQNAHKLASLLYKRIKEIHKPHGNDEAELLKAKLILIATSKTIPLTNRKPR